MKYTDTQNKNTTSIIKIFTEHVSIFLPHIDEEIIVYNFYTSYNKIKLIFNKLKIKCVQIPINSAETFLILIPV